MNLLLISLLHIVCAAYYLFSAKQVPGLKCDVSLDANKILFVCDFYTHADTFSTKRVIWWPTTET